MTAGADQQTKPDFGRRFKTMLQHAGDTFEFDDVVTAFVDSIRKEELRDALWYFVRISVPKWARPQPARYRQLMAEDEDEPAAPRGSRSRSSGPSWRAVHEPAWKRWLAETVAVNADGTGKRVGALTADDVKAIAERRFKMATDTQREAQWWRDLADAMLAAGVAKVQDLPTSTLEAMFRARRKSAVTK